LNDKGRTSEQLNPFQNENEPSKNSQVVRLKYKPTRGKVAIRVGADFTVVARSILEKIPLKIGTSEGWSRNSFILFTNFKTKVLRE